MNLTVSGSNQALSIRTRPDGVSPSWWLDLDLNGQPIYRIGNICGTCEAMFESVNNADLPLTPSELSEQLGQGLKVITPQIIDTISKILPEGSYCFGLLSIKPKLKYSATEPIYSRNSPEYYWENDGNLGFGCDYERELILPIVSENRLNLERIEWYKTALNREESPTALTFSYLDIRAVSGRASVLNFVHFLLDGHHKMIAASQLNQRINLLSFFITNKSFADKQTIDALMNKRYTSST